LASYSYLLEVIDRVLKGAQRGLHTPQSSLQAMHIQYQIFIAQWYVSKSVWFRRSELPIRHIRLWCRFLLAIQCSYSVCQTTQYTINNGNF